MNVRITVVYRRIDEDALNAARAIKGDSEFSIPGVSNVTDAFRILAFVNIRRCNGNLLIFDFVLEVKRGLTVNTGSITKLSNNIERVLVNVTDYRRRQDRYRRWMYGVLRIVLF